MIAEFSDSAYDLVDLVSHVSLSDSHPIDQHRVINLLLSDAFIVFLQISMLHMSAVMG